MKYLRRHNANLGSIIDDTILQSPDGNVELNPAQKVTIRGDLDVTGKIPGPEITNVLYVTMDGSDDNNGKGMGSDQALRTIKKACAIAQEGTTIYVRSGEYYEDNPIRVPPRVSIIGDSLRNTILRPLNGPKIFRITNIQKLNEVVTLTVSQPHGLTTADRIRVRCETDDRVDETDVNISEYTEYTISYRKSGANVPSTPATGRILKGEDYFQVNSACYIAQLVWRGLHAPAYCVVIDSDAIIDTSPYIQNCSNINGPWLKNGTEWLPFQSTQPDLNGTPVSGPRPLRDDEIDPTQVDEYAVDIEGAGCGMLIDGDRYSSQSPIKSMVGDAFTQVAQGAIGFHITNFGYMQLVSCFAVFCNKGFYTTRGGYLSISNSVCDFGITGFEADGYYLDPYSSGITTQDYFSTVGAITINTPGSGFLVAPSITIDPPTVPGGIQATAEATIDPILGIINVISVTNPGFGYDFQPQVTITPAQGASATVNLAKNLFIEVFNLANKPQVGSLMLVGNIDPITGNEVGFYVSATTNSSFAFKYDEQKCRRDVGIILEAVLADAVLNTNHQSVYAGLSYLRSYSSKVTSLQKSQTIAGLQEAKNQALTYTSNVTMQTRIADNFNIVTNIINLGVAGAATVSLNPTTPRDPGFYEAGQALLANKTFIQDEIVAWLADRFGTFNFDSAKCKRDVGLILEAVIYDFILGTNHLSRTAGLSYLRSYSTTVTADQKAQTIAGLNYARDRANLLHNSAVAAAAIIDNFKIVTDIIDAVDPAAAPLVTFIDPVATVDQGLIDGARQLEINKEFIKEELAAYVRDIIGTPSIPGYDEIKCKRDTEYLIDAIIFDMMYGGNSATVTASNSYFNPDGTSVIPDQVTAHQQTFGRLKAVIGYIVQADNLSWTKSVSNSAVQDVSQTAGNPLAGSTAEDLVQITVDIISGTAISGSALAAERIGDSVVEINSIINGSTPSIYVYDDPTGYSPNWFHARRLLRLNKDFLKAEITAWIDYNYVNFNLHYNPVTCSRDIGYIVDAAAYDLITGSNFASVVAGNAYNRGLASTGIVLSTQKIQTLSSVNYAKARAQSYIAVSLQDEIAASFDTIADLLDGGTTPTIIFPNNSNTTVDAATSATTLQANKTIYQTGVATFLQTNYPTEWAALGPTGQAACNRDIANIINAITYDVKYGGNWQSVIAGNAYYSFGALIIDPAEKLVTLAAYGHLKSLLVADVQLSVQTQVDNNMDDIINIVDTGTAPTITYPANISNPIVSANFTLLEANKSTIQSDTITHITNTFDSFSYDIVKCERDVEYIIDALAFDLTYGQTSGCNLATQIVCRSYFSFGVFVEPAGELTPSVNLYNYVKSIVPYILQGDSVSWTPYNSTETQVTTGLPGGVAAAVFVQSRVQELINTFNTGSAPATISPSTSWVSAELVTARTLLNAARNTIRSAATEYIDLTYPTLVYNKTICSRDVGYVVDALGFDLMFNSNYLSIQSGISYRRGTTSTQVVINSQKAETIDTWNFVGSRAASIVSSDVGIPIVKPTYANGVNHLVYDRFTSKVLQDITTIQFDTINYLKRTFGNFGYDLGKCTRDIAYIIDAMAYDLTYEGNSQTSNAALAYAEGSVLGDDIEETLAAYQHWKSFVGKIVKNQTVTPSPGNSTPQVISTPLGFPIDPNGPSLKSEDLLQIINDVVDHRTGYVPDPELKPDLNNGDPTLQIQRAVVLQNKDLIQDATILYLNTTYGGSIKVFTYPAIQNLLSGTTIRFYNVSTVSTASTALEYVGAGVTYNALPFFGGEPVPSKERVEVNNGKCFTVTSDQVGNYRIGSFFSVNALTGEVTIDAENLNLSGLAAIGPFKRNGIPVGVQLREVSADPNLLASTGVSDVNTAPTQSAVASYTQTNFLNKVNAVEQTVAGTVTTFQGDIGLNGGEVYADVAIVNFMNRANKDAILEDGPTFVNAFLGATEITMGNPTSTVTLNNDLTLNGATLSTTESTFNIINTDATTVNAFGAATTLNIGRTDGTSNIRGSVVNFTHAVTTNFNANNPTLSASTLGSTLTLFDTSVATVNAFRSATSINIGEISGTTNIQSANTNVFGDLQVRGGDLTTNQSTFNLLNTTATTVNAFGVAATINIGAATGTTTVANDLNVNLNTRLGIDTFSLTTVNGILTVNMRDNVSTGVEVLEGINSYFKITTNDNSELITFGVTPKTTFLNTTDATNTTTAANTFAGGVGIAKKLYVGTDLTVLGNTSFGDNRTSDTHQVEGSVTVNLPDNTASAYLIKENTQNYIVIDTSDTAEAVKFDQTPRVLILNTSNSTDKDTGALVVEGGVGIEKNLTVGVDLNVDRDVIITRDLAVNGGDISSTATTFNLLNNTVATLNVGGDATIIEIGAATGTTNINHNLDVDGDVNIDGGDLTVSTATFNLANANATTVNFAGAAVAVNVATNATTNSTLSYGNVTQSGNTINLAGPTSGTVNYTTEVTSGTVNAWQTVTGTINIGSNGNINLGTNAGAITTVKVGASVTGNILKIAGTPSGTVNFTTDVTSGTANIFTSITGNVNIGGQSADVYIGDTAGNSILEIRGSSLSGASTIRTNTGVTTANVYNTVVTTGNLFGAATTVNVGAASSTVNIGTTSGDSVLEIRANTAGGTATIRSSAGGLTANVFNDVSTTGNIFGVATAINTGINATSASTFTFGPAITGNTFKVGSTASGTINYTTDVTSGTVNAWQSVTGTINIGASGTIVLGTSTSNATTVNVGSAITGNTLKIAGVAAGTANLSTDVTTGTVNLFTSLDGGSTLNVATAGASTVNLGGTGSTVNIKTLTLTADLEVQYGGTGQSSFTTNGVLYGQNTSGLAVTAASDPGVGNATTSYGILTTDASNVPVWTDTIDGGSY